MNHKILRLLWPPRRLLGVVVGMMGVVLLVVSVAGASNAPPPKVPGYVAGVSKVSSSNDAKQPASQPTAQQNNTPKSSHQKQTSTPQTQSTVSQTSTAPPPNTQPSTIEVSLTVNKTYKGKVSLPAGSNQCDVLQQALKDGVISSLTMKYISALQSYGVYVIDGIGDTNEVWWTYEVDGKGPPVGCNRVTAQQGNSIEWDYVKN